MSSLNVRGFDSKTQTYGFHQALLGLYLYINLLNWLKNTSCRAELTRCCCRLFHRHTRNLSFPGLVHQYGRCFLKDGSQGLSDPFTNYLNCCLFCLPPTNPPPSTPSSCVRHLRKNFKNKTELTWSLSDTRGGTMYCFPAFIHPHLISASTCGWANPITNHIHDTCGVFPGPKWVLGADRISSTPKCFPFLSLSIFFPFLIGLRLSIRPLTHASCHVLQRTTTLSPSEGTTIPAVDQSWKCADNRFKAQKTVYCGQVLSKSPDQACLIALAFMFPQFQTFSIIKKCL